MFLKRSIIGIVCKIILNCGEPLWTLSIPGPVTKTHQFKVTVTSKNTSPHISNCPLIRTTELDDPRSVSIDFVTSTESNCFNTFSNNDWRETLCLKKNVIKYYFGKISWFKSMVIWKDHVHNVQYSFVLKRTRTFTWKWLFMFYWHISPHLSLV